MVLHRWGVSQDNLVLSAGLIMSIGHRKEFRKLTVRGLALRQGEGFFFEQGFFDWHNLQCNALFFSHRN